MGEIIQFYAERKDVRLVQNRPGASAKEIIRFVSRSERERGRLIREARAIYDRIFPPTDPLSAHRDKVHGDHRATGTANAGRGEGNLATLATRSNAFSLMKGLRQFPQQTYVV